MALPTRDADAPDQTAIVAPVQCAAPPESPVARVANHNHIPWARLALPAMVALAAALRLPNLAVNPGWDGDEGYNYNIALNLAHGRHQMFALDFAFVQHPPLYFALAAGLFHLIGPGMLAPRLLSIAFSLGTLMLLPALGRALVSDSVRDQEITFEGAGAPSDRGRRGFGYPHAGVDRGRRSGPQRLQSPSGRRVAVTDSGAGDHARSVPRTQGEEDRAVLGARIGLLAALAYAVWPFVALQNRFGYTYNGLAFWTALTLLALLRYRRAASGGRLALCGLAATAALVTDQEAIYLLPVLVLGLSGASLAKRLGALVLALAGSACYLGMMALSDRAALFFDLTHTAGRVAQGSLPMQGILWLYNLADLMRLDPLIPIGLAGLALIPAPSSRRLVLGLMAAMLLLILKVRDPNPLFRTAEPVLPLICLGLGALGATLWARLAGATTLGARQRAVPARLAVLLVIILAGSATVYDARAALRGFRTPIDGLLPRSTASAGQMARWLNARLRPTDVVLAMPQVSWLLHARTAELLQAVAITGQASAFYPAGIAPRRWVYDIHPDAARFVVVDDFTKAWIAQNNGERHIVQHAERTWRLVYAQGEYRVYENPVIRL